MGYLGQFIKTKVAELGYDLEVVKRPRKWFWVPDDVEDINLYLQSRGIDTTPGFNVLPRRWVVERTFAWLNRYRRLSKDYEYLCHTSENMLFIAMTRTMVTRLVRLEE